MGPTVLRKKLGRVQFMSHFPPLRVSLGRDLIAAQPLLSQPFETGGTPNPLSQRGQIV